MIRFSLFSCTTGEFGSVYEGIFTPEQGEDIRVAVKTMRGVYKTVALFLYQNFTLLFLIFLCFLCHIHLVGIHSQEALHEFLREAEIMKNFDHENVVRLLGKQQIHYSDAVFSPVFSDGLQEHTSIAPLVAVVIL